MVSAFPMNHEFELAEARLRMQAHLVDAFILQESAYSNAGQPRPLLVWERLQQGWLAELQDDAGWLAEPALLEDGPAFLELTG